MRVNVVWPQGKTIRLAVFLFYPRFSVFDRRAGQFQKVVVDLDHAGKLVWSFVTMGTGKSCLKIILKGNINHD